MAKIRNWCILPSELSQATSCCYWSICDISYLVVYLHKIPSPWCTNVVEWWWGLEIAFHFWLTDMKCKVDWFDSNIIVCACMHHKQPKPNESFVFYFSLSLSLSLSLSRLTVLWKGCDTKADTKCRAHTSNASLQYVCALFGALPLTEYLSRRMSWWQ